MYALPDQQAERNSVRPLRNLLPPDAFGLEPPPRGDAVRRHRRSPLFRRGRSAVVHLAIGLLVSYQAYGQDSSLSGYRFAKDRGCMLCHEVESSPPEVNAVLPTAPTFQDIARRYRADPSAASRLATIVRQGTGPLRRDRHWAGKAQFERMYNNDIEVTDAEARQIVDWILTLASPPARSDKSTARNPP